jgi:CubicO group peptidase (beta-lactamase class C family)
MRSVATARGLGGSVLIARGDRVLLSKGYGMADLEHGVPNTPATVFRIASVSKPITAAAVMKLHEAGRFGLDDPVCSRLAGCSIKWSGVTIRQLLNHSSGIPDFMAPALNLRGALRQQRPTDFLARRVGDLDLEFAPGTRTSYSNTNYQVLALLVDRHSGTTYDDYLKTLFFDPLGMTRTRADLGDAIVPGRARGYHWRAAGIANADYVEMRLHRGNGGLLSTAEDLFRWSRAMAKPGLLSQASLDAMATPAGAQYGLGWAVGSLYDRRIVEHAGLIEGFSSNLTRFPDDDATVIVLMNDGMLDRPPAAVPVARMLSAILYGRDRAAVAMPAAALSDYPGVYSGGLAERIVVTRLGDRLIARGGDNPPDELFALAGGRLFMPIYEKEVEFVRDGAGKVAALMLGPPGAAARFARVS